MRKELVKKTIKIYDDQLQAIESIAKKNSESTSEVIRQLIDKALTERVTEQNTDLIAHIVREQLEVVLKPHIERLAALSSKTGHMASTAAFLNVQTLMDFVPTERRKDVRLTYESARTKAAAYMKMPVEEYDKEEIYRK